MSRSSHGASYILMRLGRFFARFTIRSRFLFGVATISALFILIAYNSLFLNAQIRHHAERLLEMQTFDETIALKLQWSHESVAKMLAFYLADPETLRGKSLSGKLEDLTQTALAFQLPGEQGVHGLGAKSLEKAIHRIPLMAAELERLSSDALTGRSSSVSTSAVRAEAGVFPAGESMSDLPSPEYSALAARVEMFLPFIDELNHIAAVLEQDTHRQMQELVAGGNQAVRMMKRSLLLNYLISAIGLLSMFLAMLTGIYLLKRPLQNVLGALQGVADRGELCAELPIDGRDELSAVSTAFNRFVSNISQVVESVRSAAERLEFQSISLSDIAERGQGRATLQSRQVIGSSVEVRSLAAYLERLGNQTDFVANKARQVEFESKVGCSALARLVEERIKLSERMDELRVRSADCADCVSSSAVQMRELEALEQEVEKVLGLAVETSNEISDLSGSVATDIQNCIEQAQCIDKELQAIGAMSEEVISASEVTAVLGAEFRDAARQLDRLVATFTARQRLGGVVDA